MYARVTHTRYPAENDETGIRIVKDELVPALQRTKGYRGYLLLNDGRPGTGLAIVLWESEGDADASGGDPAVAAANEKLAGLSLELESRKMYEVILRA